METSRQQELCLNAELNQAEIRDVQRRVAAGSLNRIARGIATPLPEDQWPSLMRRHKLRVAAALFPNAVVTFRSGFDAAVSEPLRLAYTHARRVDLPGLSIVAFAGAPATHGDRKVGSCALYWASQARVFLDNLSRNEEARNASVQEIEERLDNICEVSGEERLARVREEAEEIAAQIGRQKEMARLSEKIGAILGTRQSQVLESPMVRTRASLVDPARLERFDGLVRVLKSQALPVLKDPATTGDTVANFGFLESYFSNFIEGTEFEIGEAADIALKGKIVDKRPKDSHDILGVFRQIVTPAWRYQTLLTTQAVVQQLIERHKDMMGARPEISPGEMKVEANRAGNTTFVAPRLVRGTLIEGARRLQELDPGMARALYAMFLVSEVHPFTDGNGRLARLVMNAELSGAGQCRIIVPTLFRETYLDNLKVLTNEGVATGYIKAMTEIQKWCSGFDYSDVDGLISAVKTTNALERSLTKFRLLLPNDLIESDSEGESDPDQSARPRS